MPYLSSTLARCKSIKPSPRWLGRQANDIFVKKHSTIPSLSSLNMLEICLRLRILRPGRVVCDLGAAPGGWSQVAAAIIELDKVTNKLFDYHDKYMQAEKNSEYPPRRPRFSKLIAVDLVPMDSIPGAAFIEGDFTKPEVQQEIIEYVEGEKGVDKTLSERHSAPGRVDASELSYLIENQKGIDVILSDMCANASGTAKDTESSLEICKHVFDFAGKHLRSPTGTLLIKYFDDPKVFKYLEATVKPRFQHPRLLRLEASESESRDRYYLCTGFKGLDGEGPEQKPSRKQKTNTRRR
ncbi:2' O-ribose methyltransferase [Ceratobasidium sp. 392]|nr:2' O-ribose methyltransferase [Ceratobasidium sp. 392]